MVVGRDAVHEFLDEHALGGPFPVDLRDHDVVAVGEDRRDGLAVARLVDEVELAVEAAGEVAHLLLGLVAPEFRPLVHDDAGGVAQQAQVRLDDLAQARAQHLDHHLLAGLQAGAVDLGDGGGGERRGVELGEDLVAAAPPRSSSSCGRMRSHGIGETWLWSFSSSSVHSGVRRSGRLARICPSLTKVGPRASMARRTRWGCDRRAMSTCGVRRLAKRATLGEAEALDHLVDAEADEDGRDLPEALPVPRGDEGGFQHVRKGPGWGRGTVAPDEACGRTVVKAP